MNYVDGFVAAVPMANREIYRQHASRAAAVFREYGALNVVECQGVGIFHSRLVDHCISCTKLSINSLPT